jgi:purine-nucleoside phosphorylase
MVSKGWTWGFAMTPHLEAAPGDYADAVLLSGDPDRTIFIAKTMLDEARCVNRIRGALGFTGSYRGVRVSIQTTGMGQGSFAIYANELVKFYGSKMLVRIGSCGSLTSEVQLRELVAAEKTVTDVEWSGSNFAAMENAVACDAGLLECARLCAGEMNQPLHVGPTGSSDHYYHSLGLARMSGLMADRAIAIDMETHSLYAIGQRLGVRTLSICTVVDSLVTFEEIERSERQAVFGPMARLALEVVATVGQ